MGGGFKTRVLAIQENCNTDSDDKCSLDYFNFFCFDLMCGPF